MEHPGQIQFDQCVLEGALPQGPSNHVRLGGLPDAEGSRGRLRAEEGVSPR